MAPNMTPNMWFFLCFTLATLATCLAHEEWVYHRAKRIDRAARRSDWMRH